MIVYRLEHRESGNGPWRHILKGYEKKMRTNSFWRKILTRCNQHDFLSIIEEESFNKAKKHKYYCACANLAQFHFWLEDDWIQLKEFGFALYEIEATGVIYGEKQVLFNPDNVKSKREIVPREYAQVIEKLKNINIY